MEKLKNLSLKRTIILYMVIALVSSFLLSALLIQTAIITRQQITWKYVDEIQYLETLQSERLTYELPVPHVKHEIMDATDRAVSEICDFIETYIILILSIAGSCLAVFFFYKNKLNPPIEELKGAAEMVGKEELDFHVTYENKDELLHTKPLPAWQYVLGKTAGGFFSLAITLGILTTVFSALCMIYGKAEEFSFYASDLIFAACVFILPNMLMIVSVYAILALIFKNPLAATPLLFLYILYSNMGSAGADGQYGYRVRALSILVRFPGKFFDTELPSMLVLNQIFLIIASEVLVALAVYVWKRRRVY